ncbi:MAG: PilT/PilU family type 4a pilus ATPase [Propionicimonas sp.]
MTSMRVVEGTGGQSPTDRLNALLRVVNEAGASDLHLSAGQVPLIRLHGALMPIREDPTPFEPNALEIALMAILDPRRQSEFAAKGEVDLAYATAEGLRFRVNVYRQSDQLAGAFRLIPTHLPGLSTLGVPAIAEQLALAPNGLVLVTGPAGSGKSTTLAAMIDVINRRRSSHVVTVEDPIEYRHRSASSLIHQREIGADSTSFASALRSVLRQDPDVVMIGELRDQESMSMALTAAETGHLVLATLHTHGAAKSIDRMIDSMAPSQQNQVRTQISETLRGVISQRLLPRLNRSGRVLASEALIRTPAVGNLIRERQVHQLSTVMQTSSELGMHTFDQSLARLVVEGMVSVEVATEYLDDPGALAGVRPPRFEDQGFGEERS